MISATIGSHIGEVRDLVRSVRACSECRDPKIIVGGYPFRIDMDLWKKVGADGQAEDAETAVEIGEKLVMENFNEF